MNLTQKKATEAWRSSDLFTLGIGYIVIARYKASGEVETGVFLVDIFCLGVKDAFYHKYAGSEFDGALDRILRSGKESVTPAYARKLIEDCVAYAGKLGLGPHADYKKACRVFGGIVASDCKEEFSFGNNGKPYYVQGPGDSPARINQIERLLTAKCGEGNFDILRELTAEDVDPDFEIVDDHDHVHGPGCNHHH